MASIGKVAGVAMANVGKVAGVSGIGKVMGVQAIVTADLSVSTYAGGQRIKRKSDSAWTGYGLRAAGYWGENTGRVGRSDLGTSYGYSKVVIEYEKPETLTDSDQVVSATLTFSEMTVVTRIYGATANPDFESGQNLYQLGLSATYVTTESGTATYDVTDQVKAMLDAGTTELNIKIVHPSDEGATSNAEFPIPATLQVVYSP